MAITKKQFTTLNDLFDYYNEMLFNGELKNCLVNMSRHKGAHGFFAPERWKESTEGEIVHEISLNPDTMNRTPKEWQSTLVHEMVHLWQEQTGNTERRGYHGKKFANKMELVGLIASHNGRLGGRRTGQSMTHYVQENGPFEIAFNAIEETQLEGLKLPFVPNRQQSNLSAVIAGLGSGSGDDEDEAPEPKQRLLSGVKIKYECSCKNRVWGKPSLNIICGECNENFTACE